MSRTIPVLNKSNTVVGHVSTMAHKKAAALAGAQSVCQAFRDIGSRRVLCWVPSTR